MSEGENVGNSDDRTKLLLEASEVVRQAHEARQRADDDASYASKAKLAAEDHSRSIAAAKGQAEADASWFTTTKQGVDQAQATINTIKAEAESAKQAIVEAVSDVERGRAAVKAAGERVDAYEVQAEKAATEASAHLRSTTTSATSAGTFRETASASASKVEVLLQQVAEKAELANSEALEIGVVKVAVEEAHERASALVASMAAADKKAEQVLSLLEAHEADLTRLKDAFTTLHARIESLLPNATSAGLATAFREQKARFEGPQRMWLATFVVTIGGLLGSSLWGFPGDNTWDSMGRHFVHRLPLIAPLVWLAIYAGRHYGMALRLQEEYAYKEAVSAAFEGYKREMSTVGIAPDGGSPLVTLCENVLRTLGQRPGRIYEGKHEDITPASTVANGVKEAASALANAVQAATGSAKS